MVDSNSALSSTQDDVRAVAEPHGLGAREIAALTVFVDRVRTDQDSRVMPKWRIHAVERLAESLDALELEQVRRAKDAADIGSGAGFPGLALAAALPNARFTLIEQSGRRCGFLRQCVEAMALKNVEVVQAPVQLWTAGESGFDLVTARGLLQAPAMFGLAAPLLKDGGALVLWAHDRGRIASRTRCERRRLAELVAGRDTRRGWPLSQCVHKDGESLGCGLCKRAAPRTGESLAAQ